MGSAVSVGGRSCSSSDVIMRFLDLGADEDGLRVEEEDEAGSGCVSD